MRCLKASSKWMCLAVLLSAPLAGAQDSPAPAAGAAQEKPAAGAADKTESDKAGAEKTEPAKPEAAKPPEPARPRPAPSPYTALYQTLQKGSADDAARAFDEALAANPRDYAIASLRQIVISRYLQDNKLDAAAAQAEKNVEFFLAGLDDLRAASGLASATQMLNSVYSRAGTTDKASAALDRSLTALRTRSEKDETGQVLSYVAALATQKAVQLATKKDFAAAKALLQAEHDALQARLARNDSDLPVLVAWTRIMQARISLAQQASDANLPELVAELDGTMRKTVEGHKESAPLLVELIRVRNAEAARVYRDEPDAAQRLLEQTTADVEASGLKANAAVTQSLKLLNALQPRIESARKLLQLIGQPAPELDIAAWAHGEARPADALKGKVVLLDFWAIWCGPCIATFPHLNQLHDEFHDKGLEIVGVTRQYGYEWNADTRRAARAKGEVTLEAELQMLEKFMTHHELRHATIVTPKESGLNKAFAVSGIPHAVLIDRKGVIRMIKVGSGEANARAIHDMVARLVAE